MCQGRIETLNEQKEIYREELVSPAYRNIDDRHRMKNIEYETTLVAVSDLECYHQALDSALQRFHALRIDDINKVIDIRARSLPES
jgi:DNA repair protein RAD50